MRTIKPINRKPAEFSPEDEALLADMTDSNKQLQDILSEIGGVNAGEQKSISFNPGKTIPTGDYYNKKNELVVGDITKLQNLRKSYGIDLDKLNKAVSDITENKTKERNALLAYKPQFDLNYVNPLLQAFGQAPMKFVTPEDKLEDVAKLNQEIAADELNKQKAAMEVQKLESSFYPSGGAAQLQMKKALPKDSKTTGIGGVKPRNPTAGELSNISDAQAAVKSLQDLIPGIRANKDLFGKGTGTYYSTGSDRDSNFMTKGFAAIRNAVDPNDQRAQEFNARIGRIKQQIGKAIEGGVLRKEDEMKYDNLLVSLSDVDAHAAEVKAQELIKELNNDIKINLKNMQKGNVNVIGFGSEPNQPLQANPPAGVKKLKNAKELL